MCSLLYLWEQNYAICIMALLPPPHVEVGTKVEVVNPLNRMNWKLSFANKVRDNFLSSLFMEISYFILIIHCLNRPHKMPSFI